MASLRPAQAPPHGAPVPARFHSEASTRPRHQPPPRRSQAGRPLCRPPWQHVACGLQASGALGVAGTRGSRAEQPLTVARGLGGLGLATFFPPRWGWPGGSRSRQAQCAMQSGTLPGGRAWSEGGWDFGGR